MAEFAFAAADVNEPGDLLTVDSSFVDEALGFGIREDGGRAIAVLSRRDVERLRDYLTKVLAK